MGAATDTPDIHTRVRPPWPAVKALFERLLELPPAQHAAALALADAGVAAEARALLAQHDAEERHGGGFLAAPALLQLQPEPDRRGQRLGPWRVVARLGSGGMGEVWEARRDDGAYDARVAVKVLKSGAGGAGASALLDHFAQEQRLLARLHHPHIARLLDAGRTPDDRPYFVLEAVDGQPIDAACRGLPLVQRLRLFLQLADAVAHAHRQQLSHRDLKPANVLVTADGQVKLLDFGIAQALDQAPPHAGTARPLTPGWASPEQVRGEPVTAATDIYSLGVLLHVLLSGTRPYGEAATTTASALRAVLEQAPTAPSRTPFAEASVPRAELAGDLDAIVLKALHKRVEQRYATVELLAADLRRWLAGQPVLARPQTALYVAHKFVRRNRVAVAASLLALLATVAGLGATAWQAREAVAALALAALALGLGASTWQARRAATARDEARGRLAETSGLVRDILMRYADMATYLPGGLRIKADLLTETIAYLERLRSTAPDDALLAGELAKALARLADLQLAGLDTTLDQPEEAARHAEQALPLFARGEPAHRDDAAYYMWWGRAMRARQSSQRRAGDLDAALQTSERNRAFLHAAVQRFPQHLDLRAEYGSVLVGLGQLNDTFSLHNNFNRPQAALEAFVAAEAEYRALLAERPGDGDTMYQLGTIAGGQAIVHVKRGQWQAACAASRQAVAWREQALATAPANVGYRTGVAGEINNLTRALLEAAADTGAAELVGEALRCSERGEALSRALEADDPAQPTWAAQRRWFAMHRGRALLAAGEPAQALPRLHDAMAAMAGAASGPLLHRRGWCGLELARAQHALGDTAAAARSCEAACSDLAQAVDSGAEAASGQLLAQARQLRRALA